MIDKNTFRRAVRQLRKHTVFLLDVRVDNIDRETALETVHTFATRQKQMSPRKVFFTNVHTIHLARRYPEFRACVNGADMVLPDGSGLRLAGRTFGEPIRENLNGTDFSPEVLRYAELHGCTVYLLGARPDVIDACRSKLETRYPDLKIVGSHTGYFTHDEERGIIKDINTLRPDILFVGLGSPAQEMWLTRHADELKVGICFAVGGLFDFIAGAVRRAPRWMRTAGIEWVFRFFQDPKSKWARVFVEIPIFLALVLARRVLAAAPAFSVRGGLS